MPAWQGFDATHGLDYSKQTDDEMRRRLGSDVYDQRGNRWTYVQFKEVGAIGSTYRDANSEYITGNDPGTVRASSAAGSRILSVNGDDVNDIDLAGGFGQILTSDGHGQAFYITDPLVDEANNLEIAVIANGEGNPVNNFDNPGWIQRITTSSTFRIRWPGYGILGDGPFQYIRGFLQRAVVTADLGKYGYVLAEGFCYAKLDQSSANTPTEGEPIIPVSGGLVTGASGTMTAEQAASAIGVSQFGDVSYPVDNLILIEATIKSQIQSFRRVPGGENPLQEQRIN